ncbi:hypothetical protein [Actinoplanes sp. NPDC020271]|uniref:hypothetical protein n=1 Tax=Actinoplanes sp. NPDC020271 TaxID=3363896 RepID=UPI00379B7D7D
MLLDGRLSTRPGTPVTARVTSRVSRRNCWNATSSCRNTLMYFNAEAQELETTNEERRSTNDEFQGIDERLQQSSRVQPLLDVAGTPTGSIVVMEAAPSPGSLTAAATGIREQPVGREGGDTDDGSVELDHRRAVRLRDRHGAG